MLEVVSDEKKSFSCFPQQKKLFAENRPEVSFVPCSTKADKHVGRQKLSSIFVLDEVVYILVLYTRKSRVVLRIFWYGSLSAPYLITVYVKLRETKIETNACITVN